MKTNRWAPSSWLPLLLLSANLLPVGIWAQEVGQTQGEGPRPLQGQVALVTGSTSGLGRVLAHQLSELGAHVVVHGRNEEAGEAVVDSIRRTGGRARFYRADLGSRAEVRQLAAAVRRDYERLDLFISNAGVGPAPNQRLLSVDGMELRFQVNYLAGYQLTHLLLPLLRESAPSQIVMVASRTQADLDFDDVMMENDFSGGRAYARSKLAQIMFAFDLAPGLEGSGVRINAVHPAGVMDTKMMEILGREPLSTPEDGARSVMNVVFSREGWNGRYFFELEPGVARDQAYDPVARARLREISRELTGVGGR
jgi:NAD(P)-dependent dehydrogenase (short-subunit alcohol dehydrogenase family)